MNTVREFLKERIAPLEDNYGTEQYSELLDELERGVEERLTEPFFWRLSWRRSDGKTGRACYSSETTPLDVIVAEAEKLAAWPGKRPVQLQKIVMVGEWK